MSEQRSLVDVVEARAAERPGETVYTFVEETGSEGASVTWRDLDRTARAIGARLQAAGASGQRAVLIYPPGLDFISAFLGCLYGGTTAVPVHPPRRGKPDPRLAAIVADARPAVVLTTRAMREQVEAWAAQAGARIAVIASDDLADGEGDGWRPVRPAHDRLAFLQYTSGSTATPKGVMVTHGNLLHNEEAIRRAFGQSEQSVIVSWLPLYHDMGLIGGVLQPLYAGARCVLMSPLTFLQTPLRWLEAISRYRGTTSGGPNFAYELCIRKVGEEERARLDLSSWNVAFNGAEPVRADTLRRFAEAFAPAGFDGGAFRPCYGLAEATLLVSAYRAGRPATADVSAAGLERGEAAAAEASAGEAARTLVSCGLAEAGHRVVIVDPETRWPSAPGQVGEIWVSGPSVAAGYWNRPEASEEVFRARLADGGDASAFLRTGDLGFVRDGDLFVAGRLKDLIIVRGRNHHPHDIELTAERAHASVRPGAAAAFALEVEGEERLVVACEIERHPSDDAGSVAEAVRRAVSDEHQLAAHDVVLLRAGTLPKTSSGKIRRHACRQSYAAGEWTEIASTRAGAAPAGARPASAERGGGLLALVRDLDGDARLAVVSSLCRREVARLARVETSAIDPSESLTRLGVESLGAVELLHTVERELGISLPLGELLRGPSVTEVAQLIVRELESPSQDRPLPRLDAAAEAPAEYPLSYGQRALWFVQRLAPESGAYNVAAAARVRSALDVPALRRACVALVARHPALRSTFHETPGDPVQRVSGAAEIDFRVEDAAGWSEPELAARLGAEADRAFDLARGPLFRVVLFRDAEGGHRLLVVVHHIVTDFWTMRVLLGELAALYGQEIGGAPAELAPPAFSFAGHVAAERERLDGPEGERLWAYWSEQLRGAPRELELATDHPRGRTQGFRGASEFLQLPAELSEAVRAFARARGVTAHAVLLAAYQVLLHRYSGQRDLLVGVPAAGRTGPDWAGVAGYFVNPLPIRARFDGDPRFDEVVAQAQAATVAALEHQSYPFPLLAQRLQPERDPARPPLVQAVFTWHAPDADAALGAFALGEAGAVARLGGLTLESMRLERGTSSFDLSLGMSELGGRLIASLQYDADLFEQGTAAGLLRHLERLLAEATANPERRTGEIDFLSGAERARLLGESSPVTHPHAFTHELFARQAAATPERTALVHGGQRVSYAELDARANRLAHWLRGAGAGPEVRVAVLLERTPEMVAALLAVLKSGAAYVPFDAANPAERLRYMLEDARVSLVLTTAALAERLPETAARVVHLDTLGDELERQPADAPESGVRPENLSHVIFTSGSTGRPKGVMIRHSSASVLLHWMRDTFTDGERGCALFSTSITFDVSVAEIFGTLCWGGTGVLVENALELARASEPVVYASMVPTAAAELLRTGGIPASLRTLNLGGEPVPPELAQGLYALGTVEKVGNAYGPTEDTTYTSFSLIPPGASEVRVGRPLPGTRAYVLDANLRPVPVGVVGELYLAGEGLSRGYAARPALTAERYLPDPFGPAGSRMYRVMDRVRWRADGELEYFGRTDQQVKIRGFRIELGEIGTVLGTHPAVAEAVVVARPHAGDKRLVAYVVAQPGAPADAAELRAHLEARLPAYMVPAEFVWLDRLPLTGSGKIDRLALPEPEWGQAAAESFIAPRTPTEELLAGIYAEVLGVERVGVQDSFFELGGHSLLATRVVSRVRNVLGAELPLPAVFQSPTVERLAAALEGARASDLPAVVPLPHAGEAPLSFAQERLWFLDHLQPGGSEYNLPAALRLRGALDERALEQSLGELVRRHESLRTTFASAGGEPVQVIHPAGEWALEIEDLSNLSADERETEAERRARDEAERPFDLAAGPLFRARLLRLGDGDHVLLLVIHHVVFDGWSTGVILRELGALYAAFAQGLPSPLAEPRLQYADYAGWQGEHLKSGRLDAQLAWWRERLAGAPAVLDLPTDRPRPNAPSHRGAVERLAVPAELAAQLRALGRTEGATPFMVLLAAFQLLLSRYSGQEDVVVGSPIAGRTRAELEGLVGFFVNTLALRTDLSGNPSFRELLGRVREVTLGAYAHQELPFERLVQEVAPERSLGHAPLFQVMLTLQNAPREELKLDGVEVEWLEIEDTAAKFDLSLFAAESGEALDLSLQYATDLLDGSTARQMLHHLHALLAGAAAHPDRRVSELEMLGAEERAQLVSEWAATPSTHPHAFTHELFARKAAATPERTALVHGTERVSYAELDARANRLAHWLRASGAGPEVRVAVLLERTPELIVSLLGVLKAGAAYVPFDVANPAERLAYMIEDAQVSLVLTTSALAERLPESAAAIVRLDAIAAELDRQPADAPETGVRPENLSHVIFTSGSTGRPKGVMIRHSSASVLLHWMRETVTDAERTCALFSTSTSFDVSVAEIFGTLCWGGTGVLVENALELADVSEPVTYASMVPTAAAELLRMGAIPASLRTLNLAGEALTSDLAQGLYGLGTVEKVGNVYGPTEDTTYSTYSLVVKGAAEVRIGRPLPGTRAYVLDANLNPVPVGVAGELYLAGDGLARGYAARPALTAERFIPDPFSPTPGARMYCTQDRVRWRADGELEYFGRTDHQVKVRGFRVELGEIGTVLGTHPAVAEAVVVSRTHGGDVRLVAYVVGQSDADASDLRSYLESRLPAYMVPAAFVWLERLPLTGSGKIDRNALPAPEWGHAAAEELTPPRTPTEEVLAATYAEMLGVERVGRESNFFELGGHSLLATRVVSRLRDVFRIELPVRALFERPTLAGLAERIDAARGAEQPEQSEPIVARLHDGEAPLSFAQERLWFLDHLQPGGSEYNLPAALRLRGALNEDALEQSLEELVRRHESLRTTFSSEGGEPVQVIHPAGEWVLEIKDLSALPTAEREKAAARFAREEADWPFDLAAGPLFRARLLRLGDEDHVLLIVVHHVVFDGWSTGVILRELGALYAAFTQGLPSPLTEPRLQYADYAGWQGEHLRSGRLDAQLAWWRQRLAGAPAVLDLPTDRPRPNAPSHRGAVERLEVPAELAAQLRALGRTEGATPFMVLLAAFQLLLSRYSGQEDVVVGSPIAGRTRAELEGLVGFFVNTLALRTDLSGNPSFRELLGRVREVTLGAYAHQELPFERLVQEVAPERSLGHAPLFQVMLTLQNAPREELKLDGVEVEWLEIEDTAAKFDLSLFAAETGEALDLSLQYATDLLDASTARQMLDHLHALLACAAADPDRRVSELEMLGAEERAQLVSEWAATPSTHPHAFTHELFARQAAATPERTALVHGAERVSYAELDARANRLAHYLRAAGAGPEVRVAVLLERTPELIVSLLAVLKAGAAYVPFDVANPAERLAYMIEDAQVSLVLTTSALAERLPESAAAIGRLDAIADELVHLSDDVPETGVGPENLSHVIFTSGSTGRPKGVMIRHSSASVLLHWMRETVTDAERTCALFSTSTSFDVSVAEIFGTLCWGGTGVLVENALELADVSEPVTYASMVPTAAAELLRMGAIPASLRTLNLAGEALTSDLAQGLYGLGTVEKVGNVYGPTEDTTYSTYSLVPKGAAEVRIGRPLPGTRAYVLDANLNPVPVGVAGELYLAGDGLARGYAARPALTAERFIPDPFSPTPGARMYCTQDRVRWRADGELEYFGRTDHQVKVRGFRVELGEIGTVLGTHPAVAEAVVVSRKHGGDVRLVAYVVAQSETDAADLRAYLEARLPAYMVPAAFVLLDRLPLTGSGKIDRNALPAPEWGHAAADEVTPPRTPTEEVLAGIYAEMLGVERVGRESNFFELGGHSLLATRVVSRLRDVFRIELPVRALFERPTVAGLAERIDAARRTDRPAPPPIVARPHDGEAPLSFAQERLWFVEQMHPGTASNNIARPLHLAGPLDVRALQDALDEVVRRHETLRTTFASVGGRPVQKIAPTGSCPLHFVDLEPAAEDEREARAARLVAEESERPFDLAAGPLFRAMLVRSGPEDHTLLLTMHHIVSDGWSLGVLVGEVAELYRAFLAGEPSPLAPLAVQYSDFCRWQREWLQGDVLEVELRYWVDRLGGPQPLLQLPTDRPRGPVRSGRGAVVRQSLPSALVEKLERLALGSGASPFMALLAGFVSLLNRYTGQDDVRVGTFIANRTRAEVEPLFGFFLNNLVLRAGVSADDTFRTLLAHVRDVTLDAYAHQEVPFEKVLEAVNPERTLSHTPLFQVMFVLQNTPVPALRARDLTVRALPVESTGSNFDLTLWVEETDGLRLTLQYDTDLFDDTTIERLLGHLAALLEGAVADPDAPLGRIPLLDAAERHALLVEINDTGPVPATDRPGVHHLIESQAHASPDAVAVRQGRVALTYGELNATANRLAHNLRARGVGTETRVALLANRSPRMIAGLLGILKSGAAYVPLDPRAPAERLAHILRDSGAAVLVADEPLVGDLSAHVPAVVALDGAWGDEDGAPSHDPAPLGGGNDAAYVIYTSGSTGRPKGVLVEHRSMRAYTETAAAQYAIGPEDRLLQFASVSFDASIEEIFPALVSGAALVLRDDAMLGSPALFWEACAREGVTVVNLPTAYWHELAGALEDGGSSPIPPSVRLVIIGGERALNERVARWQRVAGPGVRLVNTYGPTEATVVATLRDLAAWDAASGREVPIGGPVRGARAYVLDAAGEPSPVGVPGELYLGGAGLARGYLDRPALTAERFVPDPFAAEPGARLYRTGDLARVLPGGDLEFAGRGDGQIKIRGYRVELQEIEARLADHPAVRTAAVVLRKSPEGEPYLAAFVVPAGDEAPTTAEVRAFLGQSLPEYMVPSLVVRLDALPMTPGGKVDARALPATERPREESSAAYVAPRTPAEEILASIWAQVLGVERVGVNDSFFELGGYSLLATQVIARIRDAFGVELPLVKVFQARTLAELAESVTDASRTPLPELRRVPRDGPLPLSFAQERIWFLTQLAPELSAYHVPRALRIRGPLTREAIEQSYAALVQRHEVLRTTFPAVNGRPVQVIHPSATVEVPLVDLSGLPEAEREAEVQRIILEVGRKRFDLTHGPLIRVVLLRLGPDEHVAVQAEHHLVHDGWAEGVLMGDLLGAFSAFVEGRPVELPELPIQFADYAAWQRKWVDGPVLEEQLAYWKEQLAGAPAVLELPTDRPRPPVQRFQGGEEFLRLSGPTVAALQEMGRHEGVTLFMAALAGFNALLHRYTGQDDVVVGTVLANRRWREAEGLLGMILNTLPLRTRMHGDPTVRELLAEVRQTCLGAYGHQDTPFEMIVDAVRPPRNLSYPPVFQVMFAFHDARMPTLRAPGFTFTPLDAHNRSSKFDMLVIAQANADGEGMTAAIEYNSDLFDAATIQRFTRHLENLLVTLPHSLDLRLSELPLMDGDERAELAGWNATSSPYAQAECLHELFEAQAARTPDADAVVWGEETWSYARLDARANAVAAELRARGVGPEVRVGVCARRTPALVAGLLGVMKAGGAYVPVDPAYPRDRQTYMLQDAGVAVVLGDEAVAECAGDVPVVSLELGERHEAPPRLAMPGNLAYVIYTSGSTGRPKGVAIEHRSAVAFACWAREVFEPEEFEAVLASTSVCFDLSVFELFVTLAWGGCVVLAENVLELPRLAAAERVRLVNTVPSGLAELVRTGGVPASVRTVNLAGEPLPGTLVEEVYARTGVRRVLNLYGPSEDTTYSTGAEIPRGERMPSIGGPIANTQAHVVDARGRLTPVGVPGELYLGGAGLARGYWNRPALTAERFVPDPHGGVPGARLYRTGDQVRRGRTGALEFLGRRDHQVKVRGFRIELGEIDAVLRAHPAVLESVTVVREDAPGDRRLVAYVAAKPGASADAAALRAHLEERLPAYMVPAAWVWLERLPLSPTGKIDRAALPAPEAPRADADADYAAPQSELTRAVAGVWAEVLGVEKVGLRSNFFDLGGHSLLALRAQHRLSEVLGRHVPLMQIFRHPTVQSLAEVLGGAAATDPAPGSPAEPAGERGRDVAIIGWAGRFPGADSVDALWRNVRAGIESVSFFSDDELLAAGVPAELLRDPAYVRAKGVLDGIERFDAAFFDVGPREAEITDPQHRIFLECAWEALEDAAYDPRRYGGSIGVFAGAGQNGYWMNAYADPEVVRNTGHTAIRLGNEKDFLPTRVSYKLGLRGPSVNVQTACSTSLVAVHLACQSLLRGECDMALAGAAQVASQQKTGYVYAEGGVHSPDGRCRAFDARAQGTVGGNGVGIVVLKPLDRALADRDHVYAVIRGSAINNDGSVKVGFTAPAVDGQAQAIAAAQRAAGVSPDEIGYVEAHGTGTPIGDPIEFAALAQVFGEGGATPCALGSIKTNIGHLDVAAGVTGLIKAALVVRDGVLPPSLHFEALNPRIAASGALEVNARLREWTDAPHPRRAGVSSFGLGGTNAHVVVEQPAPVEPPAPWTRGAHLLVVSARTQAALDAAAARLGRRLREGGDDLADVAYTLQVGRGEFAYRRAVVCQGREDGALALESGRGALDGRAAESASVAFQFAGEETAQVGMGEELYASEPTFRAAVDRFAELFRGALEMDLREVLYPSAEHRAEAEALLRRPSVAGAALFTVEAALAELWMEWGVRPEAMIGHGAGEVAAAFVAGVFAAEEAVRLVAERGRFVERLPAGAALADLPDEALMGLAGELGRMAPRRPRIPFVSTVTGTWIREREAMDPAYWVRQLRESTAFDQGMRTLLEEPRLLVEVGPGRTLTERAAATESARAVASLAGAGGAQEGRAILEALGTLWVEGVTPDWAAYHRHAPRSRVSLPTYPFQRERYWLAAPTEFGRPAPRPAETAQASPAAPRKVGDVGEWFYVSQWKPAPLPADSAAGRAGERWLLFVDEARVGAPLAEALARSGAEVTTVAIGERFAAGDGGYTVDPRRAEDYRSLVDDLAARGRLPQRIVHLWNVVPQAEGAAAARERGFDSLLHLTRALVAAGADDPLRIDVVTTGVQSVDGSEPLGADKATVLGICRVAPQERRNLSCRSIDLVLSSPDPRRDEAVVAELLRELRADSPERVVAYRRGVRWAESFARVQAPPQAADSRLRRNGVYLLLGGAGRIGLVTAGWLAREVGARLVLTSRSGAADPEAVRALEAAGAEVLVLPCDVSDEGQLRQVVERTMERFGALHGVIHTAGVVGQRAQRALEETGSEAVSEQFAAKVDGLRVLERVIGGLPLDFCLLFSSLSPILGGLGYTAYSAANHFVDAFARARSRDGGFPWTSVAWDAWRFGTPEALAAHADAIGVTPADAVEALPRALGLVGLPYLVISTADLDARRTQWVTAPAPAPVAAAARAVHPRPTLFTQFVPPRTPDEEAIAHVWSQFLAIEPIGVYDSFFELGGHSLLATQVTSRLRQTVQVDIPLRAFLEMPTVAGQAELLEALRAEPAPDEPELAAGGARSIEDELAEVTNLSDEQVAALLERVSPIATAE